MGVRNFSGSPRKKNTPEQFRCGNTLPHLIKLEKLLQISVFNICADEERDVRLIWPGF